MEQSICSLNLVCRVIHNADFDYCIEIRINRQIMKEKLDLAPNKD